MFTANELYRMRSVDRRNGVIRSCKLIEILQNEKQIYLMRKRGIREATHLYMDKKRVMPQQQVFRDLRRGYEFHIPLLVFRYLWNRRRICFYYFCYDQILGVM